MNIKDYFSFTQGEKRGIVVLILIIAALVVGNLCIDFFEKNTTTDFSAFEKAISEFEAEMNLQEVENSVPPAQLFDFNPNTITDEEWKKLGFKGWQIKTINKYKSKGGNWKTKEAVAKIYGLDSAHYEQLKPFILLPKRQKTEPFIKKEPLKVEYFNFNPNTISKGEWKKLGFKDWQIKTIFNYKAKGGKWRTKADVQKIYGLSPSDFTKLKPYLLLPDSIVKKKRPKKKDAYNTKIDVNTANAKALTQLKGVYSEKYAAIIVKHRDKIGGFTHKEQLKEVWNMTEETYKGFAHQVVIGEYKPPTIKLNSSSVQQLKNHPYIDWKTANAIYKYRKANGLYQNTSDIKKIHLINKETYLKIKPYLRLE